MDYAQIRPGKHSHRDFRIEEGYTIESLVYGIRGEKNITKKHSLLLQFFYTEKSFDADVSFFNPIKGLVFRSYRTNMLLKWFLRENWYVAPGVSLNYLTELQQYFEYNQDNPTYFAEGKKELGAVVSTGFIYKNIIIELSYNKGTSIGGRKKLKPINSFALNLGYQFQLSKKRKKRRRR